MKLFQQSIAIWAICIALMLPTIGRAEGTRASLESALHEAMDAPLVVPHVSKAGRSAAGAVRSGIDASERPGEAEKLGSRVRALASVFADAELHESGADEPTAFFGQLHEKRLVRPLAYPTAAFSAARANRFAHHTRAPPIR